MWLCFQYSEPFTRWRRSRGRTRRGGEPLFPPLPTEGGVNAEDSQVWGSRSNISVTGVSTSWYLLIAFIRRKPSFYFHVCWFSFKDFFFFTPNFGHFYLVAWQTRIDSLLHDRNHWRHREREEPLRSGHRNPPAQMDLCAPEGGRTSPADSWHITQRTSLRCIRVPICGSLWEAAKTRAEESGAFVLKSVFYLFKLQYRIMMYV